MTDISEEEFKRISREAVALSEVMRIGTRVRAQSVVIRDACTMALRKTNSLKTAGKLLVLRDALDACIAAHDAFAETLFRERQ